MGYTFGPWQQSRDREGAALWVGVDVRSLTVAALLRVVFPAIRSIKLTKM